MRFTKLPPLSLYVHIPWCIRKCPYCDFNSHRADTGLPEQQYVQQLCADLAADLHYVQGRALGSIFIGGGTPSLFSARSIGALLERIERYIPFQPDIEITLEANPGTFEQQKFRDFRSAGVNRLSIGIQSFNDDSLRRLGRIHDGQEARRAVVTAQQAGYDNINLDLMHGLPDQTPEMALQDLSQACDFDPAHLSWYQLTIEPNTEFYNKVPVLPDEDTLWDIFSQGRALLEERSFVQYEVSAYCRPRRESRHNLNYWEFGDYLGIGAGAHGKVTLLEQQHVARTRKTRAPNDYLRNPRPGRDAVTPVDADTLSGEFMLNALRLNRGFQALQFEQSTGLSVSVLTKPVQAARAAELLEPDEPYRATAQGRLFLNNLVAIFLD